MATPAEGEVLDVLVQSQRNMHAALKLMPKLLRKYAVVPERSSGHIELAVDRAVGRRPSWRAQRLSFGDANFLQHFVDALSSREKHGVIARRIGAVAADGEGGIDGKRFLGLNSGLVEPA